MRAAYLIFSISIYLTSVFGKLTNVVKNHHVISTNTYMIWPNATVPFYVNPDHFDHEQSLKILTALSMFAFKSCLKFAPVMALPSSNEHVMVFVNPTGVKRCVFDTQGHSFFQPHLVTLGYDCLKTPHLEMIIMKALGFPFEHNRATRDQHIDVMLENVEPGATELFTRDINEPAELRLLPYDIDSVMHFGNREFSKNGHRTIIFLDPNVQQNRIGLTANDIRKFDIIYGSECLMRDRQEKVELCQSYPGVARRKRETDQKYDDDRDDNDKEDGDMSVVTKSLRVNPHITPPAHQLSDDDVNKSLKELGIDEKVQGIVENIYKVSESALSTARTKYCKVEEKPIVRSQDDGEKNSDILGIIHLISDYAKGMVDKAVTNLTEFCDRSESMGAYMRAGCDWRPYDPRCRGNYKSTKNGPMRWSTKHRPIIPQSTKNWEIYKKNNKYVNVALRSGNNSMSDNEDIKQENVQTKDGGDTATTEKMQAEKSVLRFGATGPPSNRKSLRKHRSVIKNGYQREPEGIVISSESLKPKRQQPVFNNEEYGSNTKKKVNVHKQPKVEINLKPNLPLKNFESDLDEGSQEKGKLSNSEEDEVPKEVKIKNYAQIPLQTNQKNRFKIKNPEESGEKQKERIKKHKNRDRYVDFDTKERDKKEVKKHRDEEDDEPKTVVNENDSSEERHKVKKQKNKQKKIIKETYENADDNGDEKTKEKRTELSVPQTITLTKQNKEFYKDRKWPGGIVRYVLKTGLGYDENDLRQRLEGVNRILKERTCVRLKEITEEESENVEDFLLIDDSPDYVTGRVGGKQNFGSVELLQGGQHRQHTAMMVMAMLGFYFEIARHDRDKYIRVHLRHVRPDKLHHFEKIRSDATLDVPYDYKSATHPAWQFWRQYGRSGISTVATYKEKDPDGKLMKSLGQNANLLSDSDILKINSIYGVRCFLRTRQKRLKNGEAEKQQRNGEKPFEIQYAPVAE